MLWKQTDPTPEAQLEKIRKVVDAYKNEKREKQKADMMISDTLRDKLKDIMRDREIITPIAPEPLPKLTDKQLAEFMNLSLNIDRMSKPKPKTKTKPKPKKKHKLLTWVTN